MVVENEIATALQKHIEAHIFQNDKWMKHLDIFQKTKLYQNDDQ